MGSDKIFEKAINRRLDKNFNGLKYYFGAFSAV